MKTLFIGGVAHGRWLNCPPEQKIVRIPENAFKPVPARCLEVGPSSDTVSSQLYELRRYCYGKYVREVCVLESLSDDRVLRYYTELIFSQ